MGAQFELPFFISLPILPFLPIHHCTKKNLKTPKAPKDL